LLARPRPWPRPLPSPRGSRNCARPPGWSTPAKQPLAGPGHVLDYLGRYTHRVALSNDRLVRHADGVVHFRWKDYTDSDRVKLMALEAAEFIRRFLLHIVPDRFVRIRHFGLLANRTRAAKPARCRQLLPALPVAALALPESVASLMLRLTGIDIERCPLCRVGRRLIAAILAPTTSPVRPGAITDTS
jgi:hypothetical protein